MPNARIGHLLQFGILPLLLAAHLTGQAQNNFEWKDGSGNTHNLTDLQQILGKLVGANLSNAKLTDLIGSFTSIATRVAGGLTDAEAQLFPRRRGLRGRDESPWIATLGGIRQRLGVDQG